MHTSFGAQQAKGIFALNFDGGAFNASHVACGLVFDRGLEAFAFGIFQVLAQQHAGPVAC